MAQQRIGVPTHFQDSSLMSFSHYRTTWWPRLLNHNPGLPLGWMGWNTLSMRIQLSISASPLPIPRGAVSMLGEKPSQAKDFNRELRKHTHWGSHSNIITHRQQPISVGACLSSPPPWLVTEWRHGSGSSGVGWGQRRRLDWSQEASWGITDKYPPISDLRDLIYKKRGLDYRAVKILFFLIFFACTSTETFLVGDQMCQDLLSLRKLLRENRAQEGKVIL